MTTKKPNFETDFEKLHSSSLNYMNKQLKKGKNSFPISKDLKKLIEVCDL